MLKEIHFVTGKGGVGKSTVALALAYKKSLQGKKVLLAELGDESFFKDLLDLSNVGYQPISLRGSLDLSLWTGAEALKEYARYLLKVEALYKLFIENPISRSLINIAPALPEIAIMGKITSDPRRHGPPMDYDCIVVDAYATGHFLALIKAPNSMSKAIKFGPMGQQNREIDKVLRDPQMCHYHIVTLPEELPIRESEELYQQINQFLDIKPDFFINKMLQTELTSKDLKKLENKSKHIGDFAAYLEAVLERQEEALERIKKLKAPTSTLPLVMETEPWRMIEALAEGMPE